MDFRTAQSLSYKELSSLSLSLSFSLSSLIICMHFYLYPCPPIAELLLAKVHSRSFSQGRFGLRDFECLVLVVIYLDGLYYYPHGQPEHWGSGLLVLGFLINCIIDVSDTIFAML
jgi:hypothetical protein